MDINIVGGLRIAQGLRVVSSDISGASTGVARAASDIGASSSRTGNRAGAREAMHSDGPSTPPENTGAEPASSGAGSSSDSLTPPINTNGIELSFVEPTAQQVLDNWVNEKPDEVARQQIKDQIQIIEGKLHIEGDFLLSGCTSLTALPKGLSVGGYLYLLLSHLNLSVPICF